MVVKRNQQGEAGGSNDESNHAQDSSSGPHDDKKMYIAGAVGVVGLAALGVALAPLEAAFLAGSALTYALGTTSQERGRRNRIDKEDTVDDVHTVLAANEDREGVNGAQLEAFLVFAVEAAKEGGENVSASNINLILGAMNAQRSDATVQKLGCMVLRYLARHDDHIVRIREGNGIDTVLTALRLHTGDAMVQEFGCKVLGNLSINDTNKKLIVDLRGIDAMLSAMEHHQRNLRVLDAGLGALAMIAASVHTHEQIMAAGAIQVILSTMEEHMGCVDIQITGCRAIHCLTSQPMVTNVGAQVYQSLVLAGALRILKCATTVHDDDDEVRQLGLPAIDKLEAF